MFKLLKLNIAKLHLLVKRFSPERLKISIGVGAKVSDKAEISGYLSNIVIGDRVSINPHVILSCADEEATLEIGADTVIKPYAMLMTYPSGQIKIGKNCSINPFCVLYGHGGLEIGDNVRIATHTVFIPANHNFDRLDLPISEQGLTKHGIKVCDDVWIGAGVTILDGCEIGKGAVIGAGSVITKSVEPYAIVVGVPGRTVKYRETGAI